MHSRISWLWRGAGLLFVGLLLAGTAAACNDDGGGEASAEDIAAVEDVLRQIFEATPADAEVVLGLVTDNLLEKVFFSTREECTANPDECFGEPSPPQSITDTAIDGDTATSVATLDFGTLQVGLVREDDVWKADSLQATSDTIPEGATSVDLGLIDFGFEFAEAAIPADGNLAFHVSNDGAQPHEVIVQTIPAEGTLQEALEAAGEDTPPAGFKVFIVPGQEVDMAFEAALEPGRYALICFFPDVNDPEMTPHMEKGMLAEFTIE